MNSKQKQEKYEVGAKILLIKNRYGVVVGETKVDIDVYPQICHYAFCFNDGYVMITVDGKLYYLHRYIYYNIYGNVRTPDTETEKYMVDHKTRDKLDNTKDNLREVKSIINSQNKSKQENTTSKFYGVSFRKVDRKWACNLKYDGILHQFLYDSELFAAWHYNLLIEELELEDIKPQNDIEKPENFIMKTKRVKKNNELPTGIFKDKNQYRFSFKNKYYGRFKTVEEAITGRENMIKQFKIERDTKIRSQPILRNNKGQAIIEIFNGEEKICETIIDDDRYYEIKQYPIWLSNKGYVVVSINGKPEYLARVIMSCTDQTKMVDHRFGIKMDNRKSELRIVESSGKGGNSQNKSSVKNSSSKYVGVKIDKQSRTWEANVGNEYIGRFKTEKEAAIARNERAIQLNKEGNNFRINDI
jgi:hypothetical protein